MLCREYRLYDRSGEAHVIRIESDAYVVKVDGVFWSNHESRRAAEDEAADVVIENNWTNVKPI